jgi:2-amino-4-hydroxy-6-hydroxymethyldihydropteridine diphosphokinase
MGTVRILLGLGTNASGRWGVPRDILLRAVDELRQLGMHVERVSRIYSTAPLGPGRQDRYLNAVVLVTSPPPPAELLRLLKRIERRAGRRTSSRRWGPRPLDIDILQYGGKRIGWPPRRRIPGHLILPHPEMHRRAFVLVPLCDVAPDWRHPVLGLGARALLARIARKEVADVRQTLDFQRSACDKLNERVAPPVDAAPGVFSQSHHR